MKDLIVLVLLVAVICCIHASNSNPLSQNDENLLIPKDSVSNYTWPAIQTESAGSRGLYKVGNKKHNPGHIKPQFQ